MKSRFKRMDIPVYLALFGALLSAIGAYLAQQSQAKESRENAELYKQIAESAKKNEAKVEENNKLYRQLNDKTEEKSRIQAENDSLIIKAGKDQKQKTEEIARLSLELAEKADTQTQKTEEIARLNLQLADAVKETKELNSKSLNYLTGGDSWCYVELFGEENGKINVHLQHRGEYPLSALRILITRTSAARRDYGNNNPGFLKYAMYSEKYSTIVPIGPLPKPVGLNAVTYPVISAISYGSVPFEPNIDESYSILFMAQNGYWTQDYSITYNEHKSRRVSYVVKRDNKILLSSPQ